MTGFDKDGLIQLFHDIITKTEERVFARLDKIEDRMSERLSNVEKKVDHLGNEVAILNSHVLGNGKSLIDRVEDLEHEVGITRSVERKAKWQFASSVVVWLARIIMVVLVALLTGKVLLFPDWKIIPSNQEPVEVSQPSPH